MSTPVCSPEVNAMAAFLANPTQENWLKALAEVLVSMIKKGWGNCGIKD